jgi:rhomboid-like protein
MFDHVAHLSGALFGVLYYTYGKEFWTWLRVKLGARETVVGV